MPASTLNTFIRAEGSQFTDDAGRTVILQRFDSSTPQRPQPPADVSAEYQRRGARRAMILLAVVLGPFMVWVTIRDLATSFNLTLPVAAIILAVLLAVLTWGIKGLTRQLVIAFLLLALVGVQVAQSGIAGTSASEWIVAIVASLFLLRIARAMIALPRPSPRQRDRLALTVAARLAHRRCAACGYDLAVAPAPPNSPLVCPECGAAWLVDRWLAEHPALNIQTPESRKVRWHYAPKGLRDDAHPVIAYTWPIATARAQPVPTLAPLEHKQCRPRIAAIARGIHLHPLPSDFGWLALIALACSYIFIRRWLGQPAKPANAMLLALYAIAPLVIVLYPVILRPLLAGLFARRRVILHHLKLNLCPCCESPLPPDLTHGDHLRLCTTCGSAWKPLSGP